MLYTNLQSQALFYGNGGACLSFSPVLGIKIEKCGLYLHPNILYLGASPDGLAEDGGVNGIGNINTNHAHCYQIQGQMQVTGAPHCYYAIYTQVEPKIKYVKVPRNDTFWNKNMENSLTKFYLNCLVSELIDPQVKYDMPARDPPYILAAIAAKVTRDREKQSTTTTKRKAVHA
ncbi:hypothetical protein B566_EDAN014525, partial [Ephemera danica]